MVKTDTIEGIIDQQFRFHYDLTGDVLYIRLLSAEGVESIGEVTDEGDILLRDQLTDRPVGLTIISWWKRFGLGNLPDSIAEITRKVEPAARRLAA